MQYLYELFLVVDSDYNDCVIQDMIDEKISDALSNCCNVDVVGAVISELKNNFGKCSKCGIWVSDHDLKPCIDGFSDGCIVDGKWLCDLCVPDHHEKHF